MATLILIVQTYTGALAYEYGPYPDTASCEQYAAKHIAEIEAQTKVLKIMADCRITHPQLHQEVAVAGQ